MLVKAARKVCKPAGKALALKRFAQRSLDREARQRLCHCIAVAVSDERLLDEIIALHDDLADLVRLAPAGVQQKLAKKLHGRLSVLAQGACRNEQIRLAGTRLAVARDDIDLCAEAAEGSLDLILKLKRREVFRAKIAEAACEQVK